MGVIKDFITATWIDKSWSFYRSIRSDLYCKKWHQIFTNLGCHDTTFFLMEWRPRMTVQTVNSNTDEKIMNAELGMDFGMFD